jgi:dienelactone hydrolase
MKLLDPSSDDSLALAPVTREALAFESRTIPDDQYRIIASLYSYDWTPLEAVEEEPDPYLDFTRQRVSYRAAYQDERITAYLFLPSGVEPPFETVVYFPGSSAIHQVSSDDMRPSEVEFVLRSGRALLYPIYKGSYERGVGRMDDDPDSTNAYRDLVIMQSKDLGRSIDYLESREDIDVDRIAYYGISWGAGIGGVLLALEPRIQTAVLESGGVWLKPVLPEADQRTFLPRIEIPTLMLGGRRDGAFPLETSQMPMFRLLGTPRSDKVHEVFETGHTLDKNRAVRTILQWLDGYLGPVRFQQSGAR